MRLPRLPAPIEFLILRALCALPSPLQRLLFGRPPRIDGQELASDVHVVMSLTTRTGSNTLTGGLPPVEARAFLEKKVVAPAARRPVGMAEVRQLEIPGPEGPLPAKLLVPHRAAPRPGPLLVFYPGGGWVVGGLYSHEGACRYLADRAGVPVLCAPYRLAPEHPFPAPLEDALAVWRWTLENAGALGADPARIAVGGDSAGGNLATVVCQVLRDEGEPQPAMQLLIYPVTDAHGSERSRELFGEGFQLTKRDIEGFERHYLTDPSLYENPRVSVLQAPDLSGLAPAYVATAGFDLLRDEGEAYARRLREAGVEVAQHRFEGLVHTFINMTDISRSARLAMAEIAGALQMGLRERG